VSAARILVADDDRFFRELLASQLREGGYEVALAEDGAQALERFLAESFELVIADLVMPHLDGFELIAEIRRRVHEQEVMVVSQRNDVQSAVAALRAGACDYLVKPVDPSELAERVGRSIGRAALRRERERLRTENQEYVRNQALLQRGLSMLATLDLERLQESSLADLCGACDAQSGALWVADEKGDLHLRAYRGLIDRASLPTRMRPGPGRAGRLEGLQPFEVPGEPLGRSFYLPLWASGERIGLALCADRLRGEFGDEDFAAIRAIGDFAATALRNARRYAALERLGLRDHETAAYNLAYFVDYTSKELTKARRYGRVFSLLHLGLDALDAFRSAHGADAAAGLARATVGALSGVVRDSDIVAKAAENELYVLLPETDYLGALLVARRLREAFAADKVLEKAGAAGIVSVALGVATYPRDGQDVDELLHVCRSRTDEARTSLARKLDLAHLEYWAAVELLLGDKDSPPLPEDERAGPSRRGFLPANLFADLQREMALEIARAPRARGLLYVGAGELRSDLPIFEPLGRLPPDVGTRVYLLGRRADLAGHPGATPVFLEGDERVLRHEFLLLYSENATYALFQRKSPRGSPWGFHTSDAVLVDELVNKLQQRYDLQPL
jgi:diguanylate cyclase (GGDEF)-like protein